MAWHRHTSLTNFTIQQSRSFEGVCVPLCLMNCLFPVPNSQPTEPSISSRRCTDMEQSSAAYHTCTVTSSLLLSLEDILLSSNSVTRNYCCRAREVTLSFMDTLIALCVLTYLLTPTAPNLSARVIIRVNFCYDRLWLVVWHSL